MDCPSCGKTIKRSDNFKRHILSCVDKARFNCTCGKQFTRIYNLKQHQQNCKSKPNEVDQPLRLGDEASASTANTEGEVSTHAVNHINTGEVASTSTVNRVNTEGEASADNTNTNTNPDQDLFNDSFEEYLMDYESEKEDETKRDDYADEFNDSFEEYILAHDRDNDWICEYCNRIIPAKDRLKHLQSTIHKNNALVRKCEGVFKVESCFDDKVVIYRLINENQASITVQSFLNAKKGVIKQLIREYVEVQKLINYQIEITTRFIKPDLEGGTIKAMFYINHKYATINYSMVTKEDIFEREVDKIIEQLARNTEEVVTKGSNWSLSKIYHLDLHMNKKQSLIAGAFIELPLSIQRKRACINPRNQDHQCFKWCILAFFLNEILKENFQTKIKKLQRNRAAIRNEYEILRKRLVNMTRADEQQVMNLFQISFDQISFPTKLEDLHIFAAANQDINLNVFGISAEDGKSVVGPLFSTEREAQYNINLMLLTNDNQQSHFCLIKDLSRLAARQRKAHRNRQYYCQMCLLAFNTEEQLHSHITNGCLSKCSI